MTDHQPSDHQPSDHQPSDHQPSDHHGDDEQLSAHLDAEDGPGVAAHVGECATCRARAAELLAVSRAVGATPPVPEAAVERAVQAALAAWEEEAGVAAQAPPADVLPLSPPARGRRRPPTWALSLAAAVLAVLVAVPLLLAGRDGPRGSDQLAGRATPPRTEAAEADESPLAVGPDLGDQSDPSALRQVVANALATTPSGAALARPAPPPGGTAHAATEAAAPSRATNPSGSPAAGDDAEVISRCARSLRSSSGARLGPLVYAATLRWQDTPAVVLAYRVPGEENGRLAHQVFVMAREDCRVLVFQGL